MTIQRRRRGERDLEDLCARAKTGERPRILRAGEFAV